MRLPEAVVGWKLLGHRCQGYPNHVHVPVLVHAPAAHSLDLLKTTPACLLSDPQARMGDFQ
jgi:hypothetical protein